ncbi:hypothetical protein ACI6Q5_18800 [Xanthomonas codiaei]|uniref:Uncharacterized protein n=1 Tax=Xanthomonas codiaei TaxID=56463 RepID=A0A2S7CNX9_9XANT|nr:hypothetical protein [Xanthomonas codiaei]PPU63277.1 hypothetical protein XcodCFBP4690_12585 [Xanthomonas codiaei]
MLFVILMSEYDFFSYDMFRLGGFGMTVFYATAELMLIVMSMALFGIFVPLTACLKKGRKPWSELIFFLIVNSFCWLLLSVKFFNNGWQTERHLLPLIVAALTALYISAALHASRRFKIRSAIAMIAVLTSFAVFYPKDMVGLLANGLRAYGVGGELPVQIVYENGTTTKGKLVFLSPENAYVLLVSDGATLSTIRRNVTKEIIIVRSPQ